MNLPDLKQLKDDSFRDVEDVVSGKKTPEEAVKALREREKGLKEIQAQIENGELQTPLSPPPPESAYHLPCRHCGRQVNLNREELERFASERLLPLCYPCIKQKLEDRAEQPLQAAVTEKLWENALRNLHPHAGDAIDLDPLANRWAAMGDLGRDEFFEWVNLFSEQVTLEEVEASAGRVKMSKGKHQGKTIAEVDADEADYLQYLLDNKRVNGWIKQQIRDYWNPAKPLPRKQPEPPPTTSEKAEEKRRAKAAERVKDIAHAQQIEDLTKQKNILQDRLEAAKKIGQRQQVPVDKILVGERHRKDMGDLKALADSMRTLGQLQPVVLRPDYWLIAGERRIEAAKLLNWKHVSAVIAEGLNDAISALRAEQDENTCRKDFAPSEAVAIGKTIEELERPRAAQRQAKAGPTEGRGKKGATASGKLPVPLAPDVTVIPADESLPAAGRTRDKVAGAVGMSARNYEKAKTVVQAAEQDPEQFGPVKEEMDRTGKIDPAYRKVRDREKPAMAADDEKTQLRNPTQLRAAKSAYTLLSNEDKNRFRIWLAKQHQSNEE